MACTRELKRKSGYSLARLLALFCCFNYYKPLARLYLFVVKSKKASESEFASFVLARSELTFAQSEDPIEAAGHAAYDEQQHRYADVIVYQWRPWPPVAVAIAFAFALRRSRQH